LEDKVVSFLFSLLEIVLEFTGRSMCVGLGSEVSYQTREITQPISVHPRNKFSANIAAVLDLPRNAAKIVGKK
jgi:hypothetical protein